MLPSSRWVGLCLVALPGGVFSDTARADVTRRDTQGSDACASRQLEYALAARIRVSDTPHDAGDGLYDIGPGRLVLRLTQTQVPAEPLAVELLDYDMHAEITVTASFLFWHVRVLSRTDSRVAEGVAARGELSDRKLTWTTPVRGYRTQGTLTCSGNGCGLPGAPPEGKSPLRSGPESVRFGPFVFASEGLETFEMEFTRLNHTDDPQQTTHLTLSGRKMSDRCLDRR